MSSHFVIVMEIARSFTTPQLTFRGNFSSVWRARKVNSTAKRDEKFYHMFIFFLLEIKVSQSRTENPQGVHRFFFEVKSLNRDMTVWKRDVCNKANNLFAFACENEESLIASRQPPLLIGANENACKIANPCHCNLAEEFLRQHHFLTQRHTERTSIIYKQEICTSSGGQYGRKNFANQKTTGTCFLLTLTYCFRFFIFYFLCSTDK